MAQMNVAWPTSRQPSIPSGSRLIMVCIVSYARRRRGVQQACLPRGIPKADPDPSTGSTWPGNPVRLPCSGDSSAHKRCGPWTKYTVGLTVPPPCNYY